ncbi:FliM/FliN family flagellar motor switch protein [Pseudomonas syringae]|uniref:Type III secretion system protein n=1 Tax=Pseudomonas syringae TaxID=317 RepID=A0A9Q4A514_PSESX|nr:FliM/FliN family flagellar motor switch protein [Pseudomonas syringae]MCF5467659.1 type III secretion system protein [Pseudomonas syringae]MCF5474611.1 type III secretion system protein [Pseudomonas syringae]MCF5484129.1 type III secretion system protein [Pseudomonas syringae]MCF5487904.1 type III secretion system protein [Pseudomonas syringae]MCF5494770.1 type III secretion system protein [Pseudomonas syringae]
MSTEDLYQDEVESLDDYDDEATEQDHEQSWPETDGQSGHAFAEQQEPEPEPEDEPAPHNAASDFDSLALDLTLRCGELRLTLAELRRLDAGTILEVSGIAPGYATLCHADRVLAEGELVDVDGRLGLQITRLAARP